MVLTPDRPSFPPSTLIPFDRFARGSQAVVSVQDQRFPPTAPTTSDYPSITGCCCRVVIVALCVSGVYLVRRIRGERPCRVCVSRCDELAKQGVTTMFSTQDKLCHTLWCVQRRSPISSWVQFSHRTELSFSVACTSPCRQYIDSIYKRSTFSTGPTSVLRLHV